MRIAKGDWGKPDALKKAIARAQYGDDVLLERALGILHRMATENTGWRNFFRRWCYSHEPLRNDASNLVRECGFEMLMPIDTRLVGDKE